MVLKEELKKACNVLRRDSLIATSTAGSGHPSSCLSCAEIVSVLFLDEMKYEIRNFKNLNNDEFILSKGHAAPILYSILKRVGCVDGDLKSLRKKGSVFEGHPTPRLDWIKFATGSLGQGLSIGAGTSLASKILGLDSRTFVLLGDSEMAEGSNYEAMQFASYYGLDNLVAIVDVNRLGQRGETMHGWNVKIYKEKFESFGWDCTIVDGHDVVALRRVFSKARKSKKPFAVIAKTIKGKGISFLENHNGWHGKPLNKDELDIALGEIEDSKFPRVKIQKPKIKTPTTLKSDCRLIDYEIGSFVATRDAYGDALKCLAESDNHVVVLDAEVSNSTKSSKARDFIGERFVECFIAEQNMAGVGLGLSKKGLKVFASSFGAFLTRAHDQFRMASISRGDLVICGSHAGVSIGEDGASQMALDDIAMFRGFPGSNVFYPSDAVSTSKIVRMTKKLKGLNYIRTTRGKTPVIYPSNEKFELGDFKILKKSLRDKFVLIGSGVSLYEALKAYEVLKDKSIFCAVVDLYCIKPFDSGKFEKFVLKHGKKVLVVEDHFYEGGIGEMVAVGLKGVDVLRLAVSGIPVSGSSEWLLKKNGIDADTIIEKAMEFLKD